MFVVARVLIKHYLKIDLFKVNIYFSNLLKVNNLAT